jgi:hypothetical protein
MYIGVFIGLNDTMENLLASMKDNLQRSHRQHYMPLSMSWRACRSSTGALIKPLFLLCTSMFFLVAIFVVLFLSHLSFISAGLIDLAIKNNCLIGGNNFKSGHTKMKYIFIVFLVAAGIKVPVSYQLST